MTETLTRSPDTPSEAETADATLADLAANAREASDFLKAMAQEWRLMILCHLVDGERSVGELEQALAIRQSNVSQQLARLRADDLVATRRDGRTIYYSLARPEVKEIIGVLRATFCAPK